MLEILFYGLMAFVPSQGGKGFEVWLHNDRMHHAFVAVPYSELKDARECKSPVCTTKSLLSDKYCICDLKGETSISGVVNGDFPLSSELPSEGHAMPLPPRSSLPDPPPGPSSLEWLVRMDEVLPKGETGKKESHSKAWMQLAPDNLEVCDFATQSVSVNGVEKKLAPVVAFGESSDKVSRRPHVIADSLRARITRQADQLVMVKSGKPQWTLSLCPGSMTRCVLYIGSLPTTEPKAVAADPASGSHFQKYYAFVKGTAKRPRPFLSLDFYEPPPDPCPGLTPVFPDWALMSEGGAASAAGRLALQRHMLILSHPALCPPVMLKKPK
jgi:hypothetical protein